MEEKERVKNELGVLWKEKEGERGILVWVWRFGMVLRVNVEDWKLEEEFGVWVLKIWCFLLCGFDR